MYKELSNQGGGFLTTYDMVLEATDPCVATLPWIQPILEDNPKVFTELQGLPPRVMTMQSTALKVSAL